MNDHFENLHEQLNEVHENKQNNLIFHGIPQNAMEREDCLKMKQSSVQKRNPCFVSYPGDGWPQDNWQPPSSSHFSEV